MRPRWWVLIGLLLLGALQLVPRRFRLSANPEFSLSLNNGLSHKLAQTEDAATPFVLEATKIVDAARPAGFWLWLGYPLAVLVAETTLTRSAEAGAAIHLVLLVTLLFHAGFEAPAERSLLLALSLIPVARLANLAVTTAAPSIDNSLYTLLSAVPLLLAGLAVARLTGLSRSDLCLRPGALPVQVVIGLLGVPIGVIEYAILQPAPHVSGPSWQEIWLPAIVIIACAGFVEEFVFRGVLQASACASLGRRGLIYASAMFAVLRVGSGSAPDAMLMFCVGLLFAWLVWDTRSLLGVGLAHGLASVMLYLILPFVSFQISLADTPRPPLTAEPPAGDAAFHPLAVPPPVNPYEDPTSVPPTPDTRPAVVSTPPPSPTPISATASPAATAPAEAGAASTPIPTGIPTQEPRPSATAAPVVAASQPGVLGNQPEPAPLRPTRAAGLSFDTEQYVVKRGDSLFGIAVKFGATLDLLKTVNHLNDGSEVVPGQTLLVPVGFPRKWEPYTARDGDTMGGIATERGTTVTALAYVNNLRENAELQPGQQLLVPPLRR